MTDVSPVCSADLAFYAEDAGAGMAWYGVEFASALVERGVNLQFIAPDLALDVGAGPGLHRTVLPAPIAPSFWRRLWLQIQRALVGCREAYRASRAGRPIVFNHLVGVAPMSLLGMLGAKAGGGRRALILHDFYPHTLRFPRPLQGLERFLYRWTYRQFDLVVTLSESHIARLQAAGVPRERIRLIKSGVFPIHGIQPPAPGAEVTFMAFGTPRANKRLLETIRAVQRLRAEGAPVRLQIAGRPVRQETAYWRTCLEAVEEAPDGIDVFARYFKDEELPQALSGIDAFVCPYHGFYSQSGVAMLAISSGLPVIATEAVGLPLDLRRAGVVVDESATVEAIGRAMREFLAVGSQTMRQRAQDVQAQVLVSRSWTMVADELLDALEARGLYTLTSPSPQAERAA